MTSTSVLARSDAESVVDGVTPGEVLGPQSGGGRSRRVVGIDIARALALIGMFTQHIGIGDEAGASSTGWVAWFFRESAGRASVLFFLLSGVSLAMIHRNGSRTATAPVLRRRGFLLLTGGILLTLTIWPASILQHYGVAFLLAPWLLRLRWRGLGAVTTAGLVGGPIALLWLAQRSSDVLGAWDGTTGEWLINQAWDLLVSGVYPMVIWIGFFTLGMMIGRIRLDTRRVASTLAVGGIAATLLFGATAKHFAEDADLGDTGESSFADVEAVGEPKPTDDVADADEMTDAELGALVRAEKAQYDEVTGDSGFDEFEDESDAAEPIDWRSLAGTAGHSGAMGWTLQTSGIATAVLGLALLIPRRLHRPLWPLAALGSMSLTAYLVHIALVNDVWDAHVAEADWSVIGQEWAFAGLVAAMTVTCVVFHRWLGAGPFEKLLKHFTLRPGDR